MLLPEFCAWSQPAMSNWCRVSFPVEKPVVSSRRTEVEHDALLDRIPAGRRQATRYALVIGNEHYEAYRLGLSQVAYAGRDAGLFKAYAETCWGVPSVNLFYLEDATAGILQAYVERLVLLLRSAPAGAEVFFYFAGHGLRNGNSAEFIPAPVDADPQNATTPYTFQTMMEKLSRGGELKVYAFTDACFSGRDRSGSGELSMRGVHYSPAPGVLPKGVIHFAAARQQEYAFAWDEKQHGLFTAVLFGMIRDLPSNTDWARLGEAVRAEVMEKAARLHYASQEPILTGHPATLSAFKKQKVRN